MQEIIDEIIKREEELRLAMIKSDVEKLDELIDESLVFVAPNGAVITKEMDLGGHKSRIQKITELLPSEQTMQLHDDCIVVTVKMDLTGTYNDISISGKYRYIRVWSKFNDTWKVIAGSVTQII